MDRSIGLSDFGDFHRINPSFRWSDPRTFMACVGWETSRMERGTIDGIEVVPGCD